MIYTLARPRDFRCLQSVLRGIDSLLLTLLGVVIKPRINGLHVPQMMPCYYFFLVVFSFLAGVGWGGVGGMRREREKNTHYKAQMGLKLIILLQPPECFSSTFKTGIQGSV